MRDEWLTAGLNIAANILTSIGRIELVLIYLS